MDAYILEQCRKNKNIRELKIKNLEHAIQQSEKIIAESNMEEAELIFLRKKVAESRQSLETLYWIKSQYDQMD